MSVRLSVCLSHDDKIIVCKERAIEIISPLEVTDTTTHQQPSFSQLQQHVDLLCRQNQWNRRISSNPRCAAL